MSTVPFIKEIVVDAPPSRVWEAITDKEQMKEWYFDIAEFKPEVGFGFEFTAGDGSNQYRHICKVTEVIPEKKLSYTWKYDMDPGVSHVIFELIPEDGKTRVRLTHEGLDNFSPDNPALAKENFAAGWEAIIGKNLKNYVEIKRS